MKYIAFLLFPVVMLGCGTDIFEGCSYEVGDLVDFTPSEDRALAKYLSLDNPCGDKISIELITFQAFRKYKKVKIRIVEVKSEYSYIGIVN